MTGTRTPAGPRARLRLLPTGLPPLPIVVPLLSPDRAVTPAQDALLTGIARHARLGDPAARDLLWRAFAPKLEPALRRCGRMAWRVDWARRDDRPWELDDLRQEAWLVFAELAESWPGTDSFARYALAYFPWRLRNAMRRLGPPRMWCSNTARTAATAADGAALPDADLDALLEKIAAWLSPAEAEVLRLHVREGAGIQKIADRLGVSRRTVTRRWTRIRSVAQALLGE